ncbi:AIM24 family protein, partial [Kitasatospora sp. NPDC059088]|uniref:AIM24 family protein n=1 Tax=Kitasatospora sp. NPDC059088 TaxID=3346722 RepID=UPI0036BAE18B
WVGGGLPTFTAPPRATFTTRARPAGPTLTGGPHNLLCTEAGLHTGTSFTGLNGVSSGNGLFTTKVEGRGWAAVTSNGPAVILRVGKDMPLRVDPGAYVAHTGNLHRSVKSGAGWTTVIGEGGGEAVQVEFTGEGLVYVQPSEKVTLGGDV